MLYEFTDVMIAPLNEFLRQLRMDKQPLKPVSEPTINIVPGDDMLEPIGKMRSAFDKKEMLSLVLPER